jgi:hypothetical protein
MFKAQLQKAIELIGQHPYYTKDSVAMQIEIYTIGGRITEEEKQELLQKLNPTEE